MIVRDFAPRDAAAVRAVLTAAFPTPAEADLTEQLRADGDAIIELVAANGDDIVGHILFSPLSAPFSALALAPVAVAPERQGKGAGSALIEAGHDRARESGWDAIFLLGDPDYYARFGYSVEAARPFDSPYSGDYFMLLALTDPLPAPAGEVAYAPAFAALG